MPDIHIERSHRLGLARARELALRWADDARDKLDLASSIADDADGARIDFSRSGVKGVLRVAADRYVLDAKLGLLLGAFAGRIEEEITRNFDALLAREAG